MNKTAERNQQAVCVCVCLDSSYTHIETDIRSACRISRLLFFFFATLILSIYSLAVLLTESLLHRARFFMLIRLRWWRHGWCQRRAYYTPLSIFSFHDIHIFVVVVFLILLSLVLILLGGLSYYYYSSQRRVTPFWGLGRGCGHSSRW